MQVSATGVNCDVLACPIMHSHGFDRRHILALLWYYWLSANGECVTSQLCRWKGPKRDKVDQLFAIERVR